MPRGGGDDGGVVVVCVVGTVSSLTAGRCRRGAGLTGRWHQRRACCDAALLLQLELVQVVVLVLAPGPALPLLHHHRHHHHPWPRRRLVALPLLAPRPKTPRPRSSPVLMLVPPLLVAVRLSPVSSALSQPQRPQASPQTQTRTTRRAPWSAGPGETCM